MSKLQLSDGGWVDPYSRSVKDLLNFILERFPQDESCMALIANINGLAGQFSESYHDNLELVQIHLMDLRGLLKNLSVPQRDFALLGEKIQTCELFSQLFSTTSRNVQLALEEAYLDAVPEEKTSLVLLSDLRDTVFETRGKNLALQAFLEALESLVEERKRRGWPSWLELELHCEELRRAVRVTKC